MRGRRIQLALCIALICAGVLFWYFKTEQLTVSDLWQQDPHVTIGNVSLRVEIADTSAERMHGLSGRDRIGADGLLFVFPDNSSHGIWMKDMLFPIDILWLDAEGTIVHIEHNVTPETYPTVFRSPKAARFVLETNAYYTDTFGITIGQTAVLPKEVFVQN